MASTCSCTRATTEPARWGPWPGTPNALEDRARGGLGSRAELNPRQLDPAQNSSQVQPSAWSFITGMAQQEPAVGLERWTLSVNYTKSQYVLALSSEVSSLACPRLPLSPAHRSTCSSCTSQMLRPLLRGVTAVRCLPRTNLTAATSTSLSMVREALGSCLVLWSSWVLVNWTCLSLPTLKRVTSCGPIAVLIT